MSRGRKTIGNTKPEVPAYIVTFSDMVTLLLTFFVLLLTLAESQSEEKFKLGQSSFKAALTNFGVQGFLFNSTSGPDLGNPKVKYKVNEAAEESDERTIDSAMEMLRRSVLKLEETMDIYPSQLSGSSSMFTVADIRFAQDSYVLGEKDKEFLSGYCDRLAESFSGQEPTVYIVGLAGEVSGSRKQWAISARRAKNVADFMLARLPDRHKWHIHNWGAGGGGNWTKATGMASKQADILIAVLE
ncbi:MAG: OmpA family protein [Planctomycetes bacterium]|nr:OmpA family protein [Planctomycetota bacterium]